MENTYHGNGSELGKRFPSVSFRPTPFKIATRFPISRPCFRAQHELAPGASILVSACYTCGMPKLTPHATAKLTPQERDAANAEKSPSNQSTRTLCPAQVRHGDRAGDPCSRTAGLGTSHPGFGYCSKHGGNTPAGKKGAARAMGRELILQQKERFGGDRDSVYVSNITAENALLEEMRRSVAMVRWLEERIGAWQVSGPGDDADDLEIKQADGLGLPALVEETSKGAPGATDTQAWLLLYREERKHAAQVSKMCIDAKISQRMVDLATHQALALGTVVDAVLRSLNLTDIQVALVPQVVPQVIREAMWQLDSAERAKLPKDSNHPVVSGD